MLWLLGIKKKHEKYYMKVANLERKGSISEYQLVNPYLLGQCLNVNVSNFCSAKQNPLEYLKGEYDVKRLLIENNASNRIKEFQIIEIYEDENHKPLLYKAIDRDGNIDIHDISEFSYVKNNSVFGKDINTLPSFVQRKQISDSCEYLKYKIETNDLRDLPVGLFKQYLINAKGFKEGYKSVTNSSFGTEYQIREHMLFNGTATIKLIEYIPKEKNVFMTKQDEISNPYPKERTVGYKSTPLIFLSNLRVMPDFRKNTIEGIYEYYNLKTVKISLPIMPNVFYLYDKYVKSKDMLYLLQLDFNNNITIDIYKNVLPESLFDLPHKFFQEMKIIPFSRNKFPNLDEDNLYIKLWIYTVAILLCWDTYSYPLKKRLKTFIENYQHIYESILSQLVLDIGPEKTLLVMKWLKRNLKINLSSLLGCEGDFIDEYACLFSFTQNEYNLPPELKIYKESTIIAYGGIDKLLEDYNTSYKERKDFIIRELEKIEKTLEEDNSIKIDSSIEKAISRRNREIKR